MNQALRFVAALVIGLAICSALAHVALSRMTRRWFESDLDTRAELVLTSAEPKLAEALDRKDRVALRRELARMARTERLMGAQVCDQNGAPLARTSGFPVPLHCVPFVSANGGTSHAPAFSGVRELASGEVFVTARGVASSEQPALVMLLQDMRHVDVRQQKAQQLVWLSFLVLSVAASIVTLVAMRLSWRSWTDALRRLVQGKDKEASPEFRPLVGDVRELVQRISSEWDQKERGGHWTPERLRNVLGQLLHGERILVVSNREPYIHNRTEEGIVLQIPASGLVSALEPVTRACGGTWVAHGSGTADKETVDANDRVPVPPSHPSYTLRRVWLTDDEQDGYYYGAANEGLWPLCHIAFVRPIFRESDWRMYREVNEKFAEAVVAEAKREDPIILVQDYHFALLPRMIRNRLPRATIVTFWHIPWPNAETFGICPWREEIIDGLLGSSILGFHTQAHCNHFLDAVDSYVESRIDRERDSVTYGGEETMIRPYPISIEWPPTAMEGQKPVPECRLIVRRRLGIPEDICIGVGIERFDYTKGILDRMHAIDVLLTEHPEWKGRFVFVQVAAPTRSKLANYRLLQEEAEALAREINQKHGANGYEPIKLLVRHHEPDQVFELFRAADLCIVSSLHDGMNLVAKEFVAARDDEQGVLILSAFAGASRELSEALIVNPYNAHAMGEAINRALTMNADEQRERMRLMRDQVRERNVYRWAGQMLLAASRLRKRQRIRRLISAGRKRASANA